jgi:hypothetical protein
MRRLSVFVAAGRSGVFSKATSVRFNALAALVREILYDLAG